MNSAKLRLLFPLLSIAALGCGAEGDLPESEATSATESALTVSGGYEWGSTTSKTVDLGTATGYTCFLTSVRGNMVPFFTDNGLPPDPSRAGVVIQNGHWWFREWSNSAMDVAVQCVATAANRTAVGTWRAGTGATLLGPATPNRQCFLTEVTKNAYDGGWKANADNARVWNDGSNWYIGGTQSGDASASAVCVDFPQNYGSWLWIAGTGSATHNLAYNPGGVDCFLTGLGGNFTNADYNDGVKIGYDAGILTYNETVVNGKSGWATCVK
jgi:hypothetical protein